MGGEEPRMEQVCQPDEEGGHRQQCCGTGEGSRDCPMLRGKLSSCWEVFDGIKIGYSQVCLSFACFACCKTNSLINIGFFHFWMINSANCGLTLSVL